MRKKSLTILFVCCLFYVFNANAQPAEKALAQLTYHFVYVRDTTERKSPYTEDMILTIGKTSSDYRSLDGELYEQFAANEVQSQIKNAPDPNHVNFTLTGGRPVTTDEYFQFLSTHKLFIKQKLVNYYLTEDNLPAIAWSIKPDTMRLGGYLCQKATTNFRGRDYIAWFCSDLPFHCGPWKLNGLPGLILQATDTKNEVMFNFGEFRKNTNPALVIALPENIIKTSEKELKRLKDLQKNDPAAFYSMPSNRSTDKGPFGDFDKSKIGSINIKTTRVGFSNVVNNPIELSDK